MEGTKKADCARRCGAYWILLDTIMYKTDDFRWPDMEIIRIAFPRDQYSKHGDDA